jgi:uncharacterized protein
MRIRRTLLTAIIVYAVFSCILAIGLGQLAFQNVKIPITKEPVARAMAAQFGAKLQDVGLVSADGTHLQGWFVQPFNFNGNDVVLIHGVRDNRQGMIDFASIFLSKGYAVLMPDSRGHGSSGGIPSYGVREADDVGLWYKWLRSRNNSKCIFAMGESMGAAILLQSLDRVPFCAAVAESPFANFRQVAYIRVGQFMHTGTWLAKTVLRPSVELAFLYGRLTRGVWLCDASPERSVSRTRVPILLIHGMADDNIPLQQSERILAQHKGIVDLWKVPKAGHCGASASAGPQFYDRVLGWFALHNITRNDTVP